MTDINPDSDINVCAVYPDGHVNVYAPLLKGETVRAFIETRWFPTWGKAKLWADEYEQARRDSRPIARR